MTRRRARLLLALLLLAGALSGGVLWQREQARRAAARATLERIAALRQSDAPPVRRVADADALFAATLPLSDGGLLRLSTLRGRPVVVNFWASWCPPCIAEMPGLSRFAAAHPQLAVIGIAIDHDNAVRAFLKLHPVRYPVLLGGQVGYDLLGELGDVRHDLPYTVVIGVDASVRAQHLGRIEPAALQRLLDRT